MVTLDFFDAFNTLRRDAILDEVASELPELYCIAYDNYVGTSHPSFEAHVAISDEGYHQGDPLALLRFIHSHNS